MAGEAKTDFSSFMCVILMLTGCLVTIMISNIVIISANPENIQITSIIPQGMDPALDKPVEDAHGNVLKSPWYLEVYRDRLIIHPSEETVQVHDLADKNNSFEKFLNRVEAKNSSQYIVLLVRENGATVARKLKKVIRDRKIDIGMDLLFADEALKLKNISESMEKGSKEEEGKPDA